MITLNGIKVGQRSAVCLRTVEHKIYWCWLIMEEQQVKHRWFLSLKSHLVNRVITMITILITIIIFNVAVF